ncbi:MAG: hypothetical protein Tsb0015_09270 [Simkaniaceae bacterium]
MAYHPLVSAKRARILSLSLFLVASAVVILTRYWAAMTLAFGLSLALRQYLLGRRYDALLSLAVFIGAFITFQFDLHWQIILPVILTLAAIFLLFREFSESEVKEESEEEESLNLEIEEEQTEKDK